MTTEEKIAKLGELLEQVQALAGVIKTSGIDYRTIQHALEGLSDADLELRAARVLLLKSQKATA